MNRKVKNSAMIDKDLLKWVANMVRRKNLRAEHMLLNMSYQNWGEVDGVFH